MGNDDLAGHRAGPAGHGIARPEELLPDAVAGQRPFPRRPGPVDRGAARPRGGRGQLRQGQRNRDGACQKVDEYERPGKSQHHNRGQACHNPSQPAMLPGWRRPVLASR